MVLIVIGKTFQNIINFTINIMEIILINSMIDIEVISYVYFFITETGTRFFKILLAQPYCAGKNKAILRFIKQVEAIFFC